MTTADDVNASGRAEVRGGFYMENHLFLSFFLPWFRRHKSPPHLIAYAYILPHICRLGFVGLGLSDAACDSFYIIMECLMFDVPRFR